MLNFAIFTTTLLSKVCFVLGLFLPLHGVRSLRPVGDGDAHAHHPRLQHLLPRLDYLGDGDDDAHDGNGDGDGDGDDADHPSLQHLLPRLD